MTIFQNFLLEGYYALSRRDLCAVLEVQSENMDGEVERLDHSPVVYFVLPADLQSPAMQSEGSPRILVGPGERTAILVKSVFSAAEVSMCSTTTTPGASSYIATTFG